MAPRQPFEHDPTERAGRRRLRLARQIQAELGALLQKGAKDPRFSMVSVTDVEVSPDYRHAKVFVSIMQPDEERQAAFQALVNAARFFRGELGERLIVRYMPELTFILDTSIERSARIAALLHQLRAEHQPADAEDAAEPGEAEESSDSEEPGDPSAEG